jgi:hypothetical protein
VRDDRQRGFEVDADSRHQVVSAHQDQSDYQQSHHRKNHTKDVSGHGGILGAHFNLLFFLVGGELRGPRILLDLLSDVFAPVKVAVQGDGAKKTKDDY